jgi:hypothetical protein
VRNPSSLSLLLAASLLAAGSTVITAQTPAAPVEQFTAATRSYALTHRRIERMLGPLVISASADELIAHINAMGAAVNLERPHARQGDIFTAPVADVLRARIADALAANSLTPADVVTDEIPEGLNRASLALRVGGPFPWVLGHNMLPGVLAALPELPPELQYRFVFRDLVLVDVHANVIVDILPHALAATEF